MTSTEHPPVTSDSPNASPRSEPASFEIIDSPADVVQPIPSENTPDIDTEVLTRIQRALDDEKQLEAETEDMPVDPAILIQSLLCKPLVAHALASRARAVLLKDFMQIKRAIPPIPEEPPRTDIELSALTLQAAVHVLLSTSPYTSEFCSRLAQHPVLAALATHPASDPGMLAFMYILINSTEGAEFARKVAEIHAARVRDWFVLRAAQATPVYESFTGAARVAWEQAAIWVRDTFWNLGRNADSSGQGAVYCLERECHCAVRCAGLLSAF